MNKFIETIRELYDESSIKLFKDWFGELTQKSKFSGFGYLHVILLIINASVFFYKNDFELFLNILLSLGVVFSEVIVISFVIAYLIKPLEFIENEIIVEDESEIEWFIIKQKKSFINRTFVSVFFLDFISLIMFGEPIIMNIIGFIISDVINRGVH